MDVWAVVGQIAASAVLVLGFMWAFVKSVGRPAVNDLIMDGVRAKRTDLEDLIRKDLFRRELETAQRTGEEIQGLVLIAQSNAESIKELAGRHDILDRELRALPAIAQTVEACDDAIKRFTGELNTLSGKIERFGGMMEQRMRTEDR